jgi:molecular chaperone GrpE
MTHKEKHDSEKKEGHLDNKQPEIAVHASGEWEAIQKELAQAQAQSAEYLDGWKRAQAEFANYRKRLERDGAEQLVAAVARAVERWIPLLDDLGRALREKPAGENLEQWRNGIDLIYRKGLAILEAEGVAAVEAEPGQVFDPARHEAVTMEPCADREEGEIIGVLREGYRIGERILRPAQVRVACRPADGTKAENR